MIEISEFPDWKIIYNEPPTVDENERVSTNYSSLFLSQEITRPLNIELRNKFGFEQKNKLLELSVLAYYQGDRNLTNKNILKNDYESIL
jgi:hypothetical protein